MGPAGRYRVNSGASLSITSTGEDAAVAAANATALSQTSVVWQSRSPTPGQYSYPVGHGPITVICRSTFVTCDESSRTVNSIVVGPSIDVSMQPPRPFFVYLWSSQDSRFSHSTGGHESTSRVKSTVASRISPVVVRVCLTSKALTPGSHSPSPKNVTSGCCVTPVSGFTLHGA